MKNQKIFHKTIELWGEVDPKHAILLPLTPCEDVPFCHTKLGELNLKKQFFLHDQKGAKIEAGKWFKGLHLEKTKVLFVYGVGLGFYAASLLPWLKKDLSRRVVFLENDLRVIHRLFETEQGYELVKHPQMQLIYFEGLKETETSFEKLFWDFAGSIPQVSALQSYKTHERETFDQLLRKIAYDFAVKNALVDEYLRFGGAFVVNFYQNCLSLPGSYLGNKTFKSFHKVPAIICGAGPSLAKNLPLLSTLMDKALVFAGGSALNALNASNIQPHLGAGIDPNPEQFKRLSENIAFEVPFYYRNRMYHKAFEMIHGPRLYVTGSGGYDVSDYFEEKLNITHEFLDEGHNVINFCLQMATQLECDPIIFLGLDLAFTGMKSYAPGVTPKAEFDPSHYDHLEDFDEKPLLLKDIYGKPLYTLWKWVAESDWISQFGKDNTNFTIINATEGGLGFEGIPNESFKKASARYLTRDFPIRDRLNAAIQNSAMPHVTYPKVKKITQELQSSLKRCLDHLDILIVEAKIAEKKGSIKQSGLAALAENDLSHEPGFQYVLEVFNAVISHIYQREFHESKKGSLKKHMKKKLEINLKRFHFLKDVAKVNIEMIDYAFQQTKEERKKKKKPAPKEIEPLKDPYSYITSPLLPKNPTMGEAVEGRVVTMLRKYGEPPLEVRLEKSGVLDGQCLLYYPDGKLKGENFYQSGKLHGPSTYYSEKGTILCKSSFLHGKQEGTSLWYYASGALYAKESYKKGRLSGKQEYYYEDGTLKTVMHYKSGKLHGVVKIYSPTGTLERELHFTNGIKCDE